MYEDLYLLTLSLKTSFPEDISLKSDEVVDLIKRFNDKVEMVLYRLQNTYKHKPYLPY